MTSSDRFLVPVRSAVKSDFTDWCCQNLSKRALNALTVQALAGDPDTARGWALVMHVLAHSGYILNLTC